MRMLAVRVATRTLTHEHASAVRACRCAIRWRSKDFVHGIDGNARKGMRWIGDWAAPSEPGLPANVGSDPNLKHVWIIR